LKIEEKQKQYIDYQKSGAVRGARAVRGAKK